MIFNIETQTLTRNHENPPIFLLILEGIRDFSLTVAGIFCIHGAFEMFVKYIKYKNISDLLGFMIHNLAAGMSFQAGCSVVTIHCETTWAQTFDSMLKIRRSLNSTTSRNDKNWRQNWKTVTFDEILVYLMAAGVAFIPIVSMLGLPMIDLEDPVSGMISLCVPEFRNLNIFTQKLIAAPITGLIEFLAAIPCLFVLIDCLGYLSLLRCTMPTTMATKRMIFAGMALMVTLFPLLAISATDIPIMLTTMLVFDLFLLTFLIGFLHFMAVYPLDMSLKFQIFWTTRIKGKMEQKQFNACRYIVSYVGPFFMYQRHTFCDIFAWIVSYSMSLILVIK
ncbi:unnamed protein product [Orchesella dallaii]|uniref:Odorant receptor n=1 Tax=Orchesella dallaii TaxID=48710 RepID=A0ABP1RJ97_9HEXA